MSLIPAIWSQSRQRAGLAAGDRAVTAGSTSNQFCLLTRLENYQLEIICVRETFIFLLLSLASLLS